MTAPQLAAGAVVWRDGAREPEVLLVERTKHKDVSLPKGKLDPGETLPGCAVRELREETGIRAHLGAPLGTAEYRLPNGQDKVVYYWQARVDEEAVARSSFTPNDEILALHWLPVSEARRACTYTHDATLIDTLAARVDEGIADTFAVVALRHAKAVDPYTWQGGDASRTLTKRGERQAAQVADGLAAFGIGRIVSSTAVRCQQTVAPLAAIIERDVQTSKAISQEAYEAHADRVDEIVAKAVRRRRTTLLCSHLPVIPSIVSAVAHATDGRETAAMHRSSMLHTADFSVLHLGGETPRVVAVETHGAPH